MQDELNRLLEITEGCREDMHEPDEQGMSAKVFGRRLDNAFPSATVSHELRVKLIRGHGNEFDTEYFNLATLIALARKADLEPARQVNAALLEACELAFEHLKPQGDIRQDFDGHVTVAALGKAIHQAKEEN